MWGLLSPSTFTWVPWQALDPLRHLPSPEVDALQWQTRHISDGRIVPPTVRFSSNPKFKTKSPGEHLRSCNPLFGTVRQGYCSLVKIPCCFHSV